MKRAFLIAISALSVTACATADTPGPATAPRPEAPASVVRPVPAPTPPPPEPEPVLQCRAEEHQALVGRPRTEIPVPTDPSKQRVACTTCPVTQDYRPDRLNFFFDAETGVVKEVRCG